MMTTTHPLTAAWLDRVDRLATGMPAERHHELLADLRDHLARALGVDPSPAEVETALARMGDPADIVVAARDDLPPSPPVMSHAVDAGPDRISTAEVVTLVLFVASGLLLVAWPLAILAWIVAVVLLVAKDRWEGAENLVALLLPFGFSVPWIVVGLISFSASECVTSGSTDAVGNVSEVTNCGATGPSIVGISVTVAVVAAFLAAIWGVVWLVRRLNRRLAAA